MIPDKTPAHIKLDERNSVEKPFLDQLAGLDWEILDLDGKQHPGDTFRETFTEVVMPPVLREQLKVINDWLEDDQVEEVVKQLTAGFPGTDLIKNNRHVFNLLLENTSVSVNHRTGEKSPTVRFVDFTHRDNNRFIAVCQLKMRILGTEHHIVPGIVLFINGLPVGSSNAGGAYPAMPSSYGFSFGRKDIRVLGSGGEAEYMYMFGLIDQVGLYSRTLTDAEMHGIYDDIVSPASMQYVKD